jgi:hypothetical protein
MARSAPGGHPASIPPSRRIPARLDVALWADATTAHEMESSSAPIRLTLRD